MDRETLKKHLLGDGWKLAADLLDQQAARIAELETNLFYAEKAEAERDAVEARLNDMIVTNRQICKDYDLLLVASMNDKKTAWIAGVDAAAEVVRAMGQFKYGALEYHGAIRALTPPEDKP